MRKLPLILSLVITAIVLGTIGTVVKAANTAKTSQQVAELEQTILDQQQAYEQMVTEANSRIDQANTIITSAQTASNIDALLSSPETLVTEDAISLALNATDKSLDQISGHSELVVYNGKQSFEVKFVDGTIVYIDAVNGEILYNSLTGGASPVIDEKQALFEAVNYMQGGLVVSVNRTLLDTTPVFLVSFASGDQVYISLGGEVLSLVQYQPVYSGFSTASNEDTNSNTKKNKPSHSDDGDHEIDDD